MKQVVIIGGGAAGMFAAIACKEKSPKSRVILLEKSNQLLAKVRISGGGRCNVTHACFDPKHLASHYPRGSKELLGPFSHFQPKDTVAWFEKRDTHLKTEPDGRMFPMTDSSETIIKCLLHAAQIAGVEIHKQQKIVSIQKEAEGFSIRLKEGNFKADTVLLTTGAASWGHDIATQMGHHIIHPVPSLFTMNVPTSPLLDLAGISVEDVEVSIKDTPFKQRGPLLITHWGFSGPAILKLSAWAARKLNELNYQATLQINWVPSQNQDHLLQQKKREPLKPISHNLPNKLFQRLLNHSPKTPIGRFSNRDLTQFACKLHADKYLIAGKTTYKQEFVTAGGVDLKEIDFQKMESRIIPGLFFAGEILNIDGITGGFNFQNAWTTGWIAGSHM